VRVALSFLSLVTAPILIPVASVDVPVRGQLVLSFSALSSSFGLSLSLLFGTGNVIRR
jgi:hypothetical protein